MITGLSAFPLTPTGESGLDEDGFSELVVRLAAAGVDSIGVLGSTGNYVYFDREQRARIARIAVEAAGDVPTMIGIGALRTKEVLALTEDAQEAGASSVLLAPVSYHPLTDEDVFGLYEDVTKELSVPLCVYDNPGTTHFSFSDELRARIAALPNVGAVKLPGIPADQAPGRVAELRSALPEGVAIGVSGDQLAAGGLNAGADAWFSVLGGLLPDTCLAITRAAANGDSEEVAALSDRLEPLWELFRRHGSLRVVAAAAEHLGLVGSPSLPRPLRGLDETARQRVATALAALQMHT